MKTKIIYGSDTGNTELITNDLIKLLDNSEVLTVDELKENDWEENVLYILGIPTWYDGELQSDWEDYFDTFKEIDFTDKTVAIFGLGDQIGYEEWFCDGIGILAEVILENGGKVIGYTKKDDSYDLDETPKSLVNEDTFYGLCLDEDNQDELSQERLQKWVEQLKEEYYINIK
tara:strand:- start:194 stop:712 length:519 start_codon:yes stop_codon:yes gene_type:complete